MVPDRENYRSLNDSFGILGNTLQPIWESRTMVGVFGPVMVWYLNTQYTRYRPFNTNVTVDLYFVLGLQIYFNNYLFY